MKIIYDRRERAQLIWVSHSYPFLIACSSSRIQCSSSASFHSGLSLDILHHERGASSQGKLLYYYFLLMSKGGEIRYTKILLFPYNELKIFIYHNLLSSKRGRLLALWRQYNYVTNILMITNSILLL